ncbi:MAG: DUF4906 domain-containing protein [Odoribacteraceae bacterium]|jgi:hypothetical protein|nr:DUF4906 domain-containing protein [Odoribacteraceae bacterium]
MNTTRIYLLALATCAVASCAEGPVERPDAGGEGHEARVTLSINAVPEAPGTTDTRALTDLVDEGTGTGYTVEDFWVLQYTGTADNAILATAPRYYTMSQFETDGNVIPVILPPVGSTYRCVLLANTHNPVFDDGGLRNASTLGALKNVTLPVQQVESMYNDGNGDDLLMNGYVDLTSTTTTLTCNLYRNVAKFSLELNNDEDSGVRIISVQLCNVPDRLSYADQLLTIATSPGAGFFNLLPIDVLSPALDPGASQTLHYYLPRNRQGTTAAQLPHQKNVDAPANATYVQIMAETVGGGTLRYRFYPGANTTDDFNINPNYYYYLPVTFNSAGTDAGDSRVEDLGQVHLADANSYIINPLASNQATYGVPVIERVNNFWNRTNQTGIAITTTTEWVAEVIWQDKPSRLINFCTSNGVVTPDNTSFEGTGDGRFYFQPVQGAAGNVLIGVRKKGEATYLWSWHLWITDYNPDEAPSSWQADKFAYPVPGDGQVHHYTGGPWANVYNNKFIMDRDLGAASADRTQGIANTRGMLYQFGRKDPFPTTNSDFAPVTLYDINGQNGKTGNAAIPITVNRTSFEGAVKDPTRFYAPGDGNNDWLVTNPYYTELWNNPAWNAIPAAGKSFFDPCPPGWKLPIIGTWDIFTRNNVNNPSDYGINTAGWEFYMDNVLKNAWAYYPASGYRLVGTGGMLNERIDGVSWASTPDGSTHVLGLYFHSSDVYSHGYHQRGLGIPVRCVQE